MKMDSVGVGSDAYMMHCFVQSSSDMLWTKAEALLVKIYTFSHLPCSLLNYTDPVMKLIVSIKL